MKYLLALLILIALPAWAGWTKVSESDDDAEVFLDYDTLRRDGNLRRIWQLYNLSPNDKNGWGSVRSRVELDCKNETLKTLSYSVYSKHFTTGVVIHSKDEEQPKRDIAPATISWTVLKEVCKR